MELRIPNVPVSLSWSSQRAALSKVATSDRYGYWTLEGLIWIQTCCRSEKHTGFQRLSSEKVKISIIFYYRLKRYLFYIGIKKVLLKLISPFCFFFMGSQNSKLHLWFQLYFHCTMLPQGTATHLAVTQSIEKIRIASRVTGYQGLRTRTVSQ